jgi:hypothetical protein
MNMKNIGLMTILACIVMTVSAETLESTTWGFRFDPPEGYQYTAGDGKDRFSFRSPEGAALDLIVYPGSYPSVEALAKDVASRLRNQGETDTFEYRKKKAAILSLDFIGPDGPCKGWGLCIELARKPGKPAVLLLALSYGPADNTALQNFCVSALDSIAPTPADRRAPGPITEYTYPRGKRQTMRLAGGQVEAIFHEHDAEAAQALIEREFSILTSYASSPYWREAWSRYYRAIYRDSFERIANAAFALERSGNIPEKENRDLAAEVLAWVQTFTYDRNTTGSDFVNLVSALTEGRGDCDSRALLWAIIMEQADIPAAIMISPSYSHAMGLADLPGSGARFNLAGRQWLVAETTSTVDIGLIAADVSDPNYWFGITFE